MIHTRIASTMGSDTQLVISSEARATSELSGDAWTSLDLGCLDIPEWYRPSVCSICKSSLVALEEDNSVDTYIGKIAHCSAIQPALELSAV